VFDLFSFHSFGGQVTTATPQLNPTALTVDEMARVLSAAGQKPVTAEMIRDDIDDGAPTNADGTINLIHYSAWLVREVNHAN